MTSIDVRSRLVEALRLDLVGPGNDHAFARELLPESPSRWYLTGFLVPITAPAEQRSDETSTEEIAGGSDVGGTDDANAPDRDAARKSFLPSSMGLSVLVPASATRLKARVAWGEYVYEGPDSDPEPETSLRLRRTRRMWRVRPRLRSVPRNMKRSMTQSKGCARATGGTRGKKPFPSS